MRRPSGQGPGARLFNGLASQVEPASRAARAHRPKPARPAGARSAIPAANRATGRQRPAPARNPQPRAKFSGHRDRHGEKAFQVNSAKRYADLQKRTSPTSETALGGRCKIHASRTRFALSTRQGNHPTRAIYKGLASKARITPYVHNTGHPDNRVHGSSRQHAMIDVDKFIA
jgi:hypothetical protein